MAVRARRGKKCCKDPGPAINTIMYQVSINLYAKRKQTYQNGSIIIQKFRRPRVSVFFYTCSNLYLKIDAFSTLSETL